MKAKTELKDLQRVLQEKHPSWPQEKARWIAMQALGIIRR